MVGTLARQNRDKIVKATVMLPTKGGSGVLVPGGLIATAAHCLDWELTGSMAAWSSSKPPVQIRTYRGETIQLIPYAVEPCSDIAILGSSDDQDFPEDNEAFQQFSQNTKPIIISRHDFTPRQEINVHIYGWKKRWVKGEAMQRVPSPLWTYMETHDRLEGGFSGGPIVDEAGELVGIFSWGGEGAMPDGRFYASFARPHLALPTWICNEIFGRSAAESAKHA